MPLQSQILTQDEAKDILALLEERYAHGHLKKIRKQVFQRIINKLQNPFLEVNAFFVVGRLLSHLHGWKEHYQTPVESTSYATPLLKSQQGKITPEKFDSLYHKLRGIYQDGIRILNKLDPQILARLDLSLFKILEPAFLKQMAEPLLKDLKPKHLADLKNNQELQQVGSLLSPFLPIQFRADLEIRTELGLKTRTDPNDGIVEVPPTPVSVKQTGNWGFHHPLPQEAKDIAPPDDFIPLCTFSNNDSFYIYVHWKDSGKIYNPVTVLDAAAEEKQLSIFKTYLPNTATRKRYVVGSSISFVIMAVTAFLALEPINHKEIDYGAFLLAVLSFLINAGILIKKTCCNHSNAGSESIEIPFGKAVADDTDKQKLALPSAEVFVKTLTDHAENLKRQQTRANSTSVVIAVSRPGGP